MVDALCMSFKYALLGNPLYDNDERDCCYMAEARIRRSAGRQANWFTRHLPLLSWLPSYSRKWLTGDIFAGFAVWAVLVPQAVAYAQIAGMPPQAALFAAPVALIAYAVFGTSRQLVVGVTSSIAITSAATVGALASGNNALYVSLTIELALLVGVLFLLFGIARFGFVSSFLARPVITGFLFGLSLVIAIGQAPKLFGVPAGEGNFFQKAWSLLTQLGNTNGWTLFVGLTSLALLFALSRFVPKLPAYLITVIFGILVVTLLGLVQRQVTVVGTIPGGFPTPAIPRIRLEDLVNLLTGAFGIMFVGFAEHISASRGFAISHNDTIDPDEELIALGAANLAAGLFQGFALGGGLSQSTVNDQAGARSQLSGIIAAGLLLLTVLFLTPLFGNLPQATLGAVVIYAVSHSWKVGELQRYLHLKRSDFFLALTALLGELLFNVLPGLLLAVALSLLILVYRASRPNLAVLGRVPGTRNYSDRAHHPENEMLPGLLIVRVNAPLFFANTTNLRERIQGLIQAAAVPPTVILLSMEASNSIDIASLDALSELHASLHAEGIALELANVRWEVQKLLERAGLVEKIGKEHIYTSVDEAVQNFHHP